MGTATAIRRSSIGLWLHVLSLDAPVVALVWQDFLARCNATSLRPAGRCVLGLTVWAIYLADRLMDVRLPVVDRESGAHAFCRHYQSLAKSLLLVALVADVLTAALWLRPTVFSDGLWVGAAVASYLAIFAIWRVDIRFGKQLSAAVLFTTGVFLVIWTQAAHPWPVLVFEALTFAFLCLGNLMLIEGWDHHRRTPRVWLAMLVLAAGCLLGGVLRWQAAIASAAMGLAALDWGGRKLPEDTRRVLADAVLLTPLLFR